MASGMATRCPACSTVFRVVPDQLRVSEGWVRCGRCSEVFNAAQALLDLDTGAPRGGQPDTPRAGMKFGSARPSAPVGSSEGQAAAPPAMGDFGPRAQPQRPPEAPPKALPKAPPQTPPQALPPAPQAEPVPTMDEAVSRFAADAAEVDGQAEPAQPLPDIKADPRPRKPVAAKPGFLRQAERAARWQRPRVRAALAAAVLLGLAGLLAQVALTYRDVAAARFPVLQPVLQAACQPLGCSVGPAHVIDSLVVESSGLVRVEKSSIYRLSVALRNRAALEVAMPALELSLTDSQGQLVARRVISASELGVNQATLGAGRELQLQATLQAATAPVAGYTIELFYP